MGTGSTGKRFESTGELAFSESAAWQSVGTGWQQLTGNFRELGYSIEWHDFVADQDLDWSRSFHPAGLEICLNLSGSAQVECGGVSLDLGPRTAGFYAQRKSKLKAFRRAGGRHQFATVEFSLSFLKLLHADTRAELHSRVAKLLNGHRGEIASGSDPLRLTSEQEQVALSLRHPPVYRAAQPLWYRAKALEIAASILYQPETGEELFCQRVKRLNRERAQRVVAILTENLSEPPSLQEIGRQVGCSHFHLSRIFAQEMGRSMTAYLRELRLERAALLLRTGHCNVTEAALEVGYNSVSHFTVAFREMFGCCPGLYPVKTALARVPKEPMQPR